LVDDELCPAAGVAVAELVTPETPADGVTLGDAGGEVLGDAELMDPPGPDDDADGVGLGLQVGAVDTDGQLRGLWL
jgi:hypothetical protein